MKKEENIRILFVEDMQSDYELAMKQIKKEGILFNSIRTENKTEFIKGLEEFEPDLVISDYSMPEFDGMSALKISLEKNPLLPFIILTGSMNEETAVECMKAGATNYVIKENILRLPYAVKEALTKAENEKRMQKYKEDWKGIFNGIPHPTFVIDSESNIIEANDILLEKIEKDIEEIRKYKCWEIFYGPNCKDKNGDCPFSVMRKKKNFHPVEREIKGLGGHFLVSCTPFFDNEGKLEKVIHIATDITERKKAEEELSNSESMLSTLVQTIPAMIWLKDREGRYLEVNRMFEAYLGENKENIKGEKDYELLGKDIAENLRDLDIQALDKKKPVSIEAWIPFKGEGKSRYIHIIKTPMYDKNNQLIGILGIGRDITDRKLSEEKIQEMKEHFEAIFNTSPDLAVITDIKEGRILNINNGFEEGTGHLRKDIIGKTYSDIGIWKNLEDRKEIINALKQNGEIHNHEAVFVKKNGEEIIGLSSAKLINLNGIPHIISVTRDVTSRMKTEKALRHSETHLQNAVRMSKMGYWEYDVLKDEFTFSESLFNIYHTNAEKAGGYKMTSKEYAEKYVFQEDIELVHKEIEKTKLTRDPKYMGKLEHRMLYDNGNVGYISVQYSLELDAKGNVIRTFGVNQDITEQKIIEAELIKAKEKAEVSDKLKSAFLANMSHEIRTPMNAIIGFSTYLKDPELSEQDKIQFCEIIENNSNHLLHIIEDILEISKIETNELRIKPEETNLSELFRNLYEEYLMTRKNKEIEIKLTTIGDSGKDIIIKIDGNRLRQIMNNLIFNAIKFTKEGYIEFGYEISTQNKIIFFVKDTGIGIAEKNKEIIFDRFRQVEDFTTRNYGGSGLGLAISKKIVELMGGEIWVESELKQGSKFIFTLPVELKKKIMETVKETEEKIPNLSKYKILIAEDDEFNYKLFSIILEKSKVKIIRAKDGLECVEMFKNNKDIDIVLMDIQMPGLNGLEATKIIKETRKELPVIAQTAFALSSDRARCMEAGCDDVITKPINVKKLYLLLEKYLMKKD